VELVMRVGPGRCVGVRVGCVVCCVGSATVQEGGGWDNVREGGDVLCVGRSRSALIAIPIKKHAVLPYCL
jgi:hypothetical protein